MKEGNIQQYKFAIPLLYVHAKWFVMLRSGI